MKNNFCILFFLKKRSGGENSHVPVYLRITHDGKRAETATGHKCLEEKWNAKAGRAIGSTETVRNFNTNLIQLETKVMEIYDRMCKADELISAEAIKDELMGRTDAARKTIVEIFREHNRKVELLVGKEFAKTTLTRYATTLRHLEGFLLKKYKVTDLHVNRIGHQFITDFDFYLRTTRSCGNNSTVKYLKNFKKLIRICLANGWMDRDPFLNYKVKLTQVTRSYLSNDELASLEKKNFKVKRLEVVRDLFLFSCYTGLAYADIQKLKKSEIVKGNDGNKWIITKRKKTDTRTSVPLLPKAKAILEKYSEHPKCQSEKVFPVPSNQRTNAYLKEIAGLCEIEKTLTYHLARHTFATTITLSNGVPIETVSKMLGHTNITTTQQYAKVLDMKISSDMEVLRQKLEMG